MHRASFVFIVGSIVEGIALVSGSANPPLTDAVASELGIDLVGCTLERFPDGELHVEMEGSLRGHDVYLMQPTSPPAEFHLLELLLMADASKRAGAERLTAVIPYFGYARQDRRSGGREPVAARVIADLLASVEFSRVAAVDLHSVELEGFFSVPLEHLSAVPLLTDAARSDLPDDAVIVAPDLGAVKLAERYARALDRPMAAVHKLRVSGERVRVEHITGEVKGRSPVIVDDMISTAGTIEAAARALIEAGSSPQIRVVASHTLLAGSAVERLEKLKPRRILTTDSVQAAGDGLPLERISLRALLAEAIRRLHENESLHDLLTHH